MLELIIHRPHRMKINMNIKVHTNMNDWEYDNNNYYLIMREFERDMLFGQPELVVRYVHRMPAKAKIEIACNSR
jgi:hypothetical protein